MAETAGICDRGWRARCGTKAARRVRRRALGNGSSVSWIPRRAPILHFSRRILTWKLAEKLSPLTTCELLRDAAICLGVEDATPEFYADSGIENINGDVNALVEEGLIHRVLAQVDVAFSNSIIEAWWRSLRNNWLHLNTLDTVAAVRRLTSFYVAEHNTAIPHSAFQGETPDELYFGTGTAVAADLA